jgi:CrcB protein
MRSNVHGDPPHGCVLLPMIWLAIAAGGALGAAARHALNTAVQLRWGASGFPLGILVVNVVGCLAIEVVAGLVASARVQVGDTARMFLFVGVLGGFTTFSSYGLDTFALARGGQPGLALFNAVGHVAAGLLAVWAGSAAASWRP